MANLYFWASLTLFTLQRAAGDPALDPRAVDDGPAVRAALAAASACGGAAVYFPPGGYYFEATVAVPDGVSLVGGPGLRSHMQVRV